MSPNTSKDAERIAFFRSLEDAQLINTEGFSMRVVSASCLATIMLAILIAGCDSGGGGSSSSSDAFIQVINAIPDSPAITVTIDVDVDEDDSVDEVISVQSFQQASRKETREAGDLVFKVTHGDDVVLIDETTITLKAGTIHTLILTGSYSSPDVLFLEKPEGDVDDDESEEAEVQVINLASAGSLDIYLDDTTQVMGNLPTTTLNPGMESGLFLLDAEPAYQFKISPQGEETRIFDVEETTFAARRRYMVIVTDVLTTYSTDTTAFIVDDNALTKSFINLAVQPKLRFVNAVPDEMSVEISFSDFFLPEQIQKTTLDYQQVSDYFEMDLSSVFLTVTGTFVSAPDEEAFKTVVSLGSDTFHTLVIGGSITDNTLTTQIAESDEHITATELRAQFLNTAKITVLDDSDEEQTLELSFDVLEVGESLEQVSPIVSALGFLSFKTAGLEPTPSLLVAEETSTGDIFAGPTPSLMEEESSMLIFTTEAVGGGLPLTLSIHTRSLQE
jgi:hypothetical protein